PELPKPAFLPRLAYVFLLPVAQIPIFAGVTFSDIPLYRQYAVIPTRAFGLGVLEDQALAGVVMKVFGLFAFGITFIVTFFNWYREELAPSADAGGPGSPVTRNAHLSRTERPRLREPSPSTGAGCSRGAPSTPAPCGRSPRFSAYRSRSWSPRTST